MAADFRPAANPPMDLLKWVDSAVEGLATLAVPDERYLRVRPTGSGSLDLPEPASTVVGVLIEVPVMLSVVTIVNRTNPWYEAISASSS